MRRLPKIVALYEEIDAGFEAERDRARLQSDASRMAQIEQKQKINDQAYFVLAWGQLEAAINDACKDAIRTRQNDPVWERRRGWDFYDPDHKRLSGLTFENRAAMVLDRSAGRGSPWAKVMHYYGLRNQIAHGELRSERIDVSFVAGEFYRIQGAIVR